MNDHINSDDFATVWTTAAAVADIVASAPVGVEAWSLDIESVYRTIPVLPAHKKAMVVHH